MVEGAHLPPLQRHPKVGQIVLCLLLQRIGGFAQTMQVFRHSSAPTQSWWQPEEIRNSPKPLAYAESGCNSHSGCSVTLLTALAVTAPLYNLAPFSCKVGNITASHLLGWAS